MRASWKLGRVAGIDVYLHPTFLLLLALIWVDPGGSFGVGQGGLASVLLLSATFFCVLLHELGHALTARRFGIETEDITLYPIGGVARLRRMPKAPGAELLIALAGPAVNALIVVGLLLVHLLVFAGGPLSFSPVDQFLVEMIVINAILGIFNLIPAFPMDGGRVLRALLSGWLGRAKATMIAAGLGRGLSLLFGLGSLYYFVGTFDATYLVRMALSWFIYMAAGAELARVLAEERPREFYYVHEPDAEGIWTAPRGFHWVNQGNGIWRLAPIVVGSHEPRNPSPWVGA
jgi:Zn-dependent protease